MTKALPTPAPALAPSARARNVAPLEHMRASVCTRVIEKPSVGVSVSVSARVHSGMCSGLRWHLLLGVLSATAVVHGDEQGDGDSLKPSKVASSFAVALDTGNELTDSASPGSGWGSDDVASGDVASGDNDDPDPNRIHTLLLLSGLLVCAVVAAVVALAFYACSCCCRKGAERASPTEKRPLLTCMALVKMAPLHAKDAPSLEV